MTQLYGPFNAGTGSNFDQTYWREMMGNLFTSGVLNSPLASINNTVNGVTSGYLAVSAVGGNMNVSVATGNAMAYGFFYENTAASVITIGASDATLNRIDYVVVEYNLTAQTVQLVTLVGTKASSPVAPTLNASATLWDIPLAQVLITHGVTVLVAGNITDSRVYSTTLMAPASQGSGSGLNADFVDSLTGSAFALGAAASQHLIVQNRAPVVGDGVNGDLFFQW